MVVEEEASAVSGGSRVAAEMVVDTTHWRFEVSSNMGGNRKSSIILCSGVVDVEGSVFIGSGIRLIRRIEGAQYGVLGFLGVGSTIIIFQNVP
ncbi:hypothetical protein Tco_0389858 [Tanacetum coccineum]